MSQARRTRRISEPDQKPIKHGLREIVLIFFCFVALYLFVSLVTYYPPDPGWSHSGQVEEIKNKGGVAGALFADIFFYLFGYFAYLFPIMVGYVGWLLYRGKHHDILANPKSLIVPGVGFVLTLSAGCGLAIVHFTAESILLPSHAGGILGMVVGKSLERIFSPLGATLLLLALFFTGVTLLTGLSWLKLMDFLGYHTLRLLPVVKEKVIKRYVPWSMRYLRWVANFIMSIIQTIYAYICSGLKTIWEWWQKRRADKYAQQDIHDDIEYDDSDYFFKQDPLFHDHNAETTEEPHTTSPPPVTTEKPPETIAPIIPPTPVLPALYLLNPAPSKIALPNEAELIRQIREAFHALQVQVEIKAIQIGPVVISFEAQLANPLTLSLEEVSNALAQLLKVPKIHAVETSTKILDVEMPNPQRQAIYLSELLSSGDYQDSFSPLTIALGEDLTGHPIIVDLTRIPHVLLAGSHAEEKATAINTVLLSLLYKSTPQIMRWILVDNAHHDLSIYADCPHLLTPIINDFANTANVLRWCEQEMERRYRLMAKMNVRNIESYNQVLQQPENQLVSHSKDTLTYLVVVVHELSEVVMANNGHQVEQIINRLTQKARAAGIHLILATQYPTINVVTGLIKANMPTRVAFQVNNKTESRTILGQMGAEWLLGEGDMLYMTAGMGTPVRVHGCSVTHDEVLRVIADLKIHAAPHYLELTLHE